MSSAFAESEWMMVTVLLITSSHTRPPLVIRNEPRLRLTKTSRSEERACHANPHVISRPFPPRSRPSNRHRSVITGLLRCWVSTLVPTVPKRSDGDSLIRAAQLCEVARTAARAWHALHRKGSVLCTHPPTSYP
ncbi:hypothetical protein BD414DRAFT_294054 [Trametes punicea]|nr:hypothetical protein BD414DRAFT_294054 [Trametes punicea]